MASMAKTRRNVDALKELTYGTLPKVERCTEKMKQNKLHFEAARRRIREDRTTSETKKDASKRMQELTDETAKIEKDIETAEKLGSFFTQSLAMDAELEQLRKDLHDNTRQMGQRESEFYQLFGACTARLQKENPHAVARFVKIFNSVV